MSATVRPITLREVAEAAGVSQAVASRSLHGSTHPVSEEARRRVLEASNLLGYTANTHAQAVARGSGSIVALVLQELQSPAASELVRATAEQTSSSGLTLTLTLASAEPGQLIDVLSRIRGQRPRLIIVFDAPVEVVEDFARQCGHRDDPLIVECTTSPDVLGDTAALSDQLSGVREWIRSVA